MYPWLVLEQGDEVVAYAYGSRHRPRAAYLWSVETSVYVDERHRSHRLGRRLYATLFEVLSAQGFVNAYAAIALPNPRSVALHEHVGFRPVGVFPRVGFKRGAWWDVGWWHRPLADGVEAPSAPIPVAELQTARNSLGCEAMTSEAARRNDERSRRISRICCPRFVYTFSDLRQA